MKVELGEAMGLDMIPFEIYTLRIGSEYSTYGTGPLDRFVEEREPHMNSCRRLVVLGTSSVCDGKYEVDLA